MKRKITMCLVIIVTMMAVWGCNNESAILRSAKSEIETTYSQGIEIIEAYYNEEDAKCYVTFSANGIKDEALVDFKEDKVSYMSLNDKYTAEANRYRELGNQSMCKEYANKALEHLDVVLCRYNISKGTKENNYNGWEKIR
ncbi:MAG: hypothetical protein J1F02_06875 [Lachnospiraceae bacterium]|nr:hypothetical protein [Lachnospiraceae bacterium]